MQMCACRDQQPTHFSECERHRTFPLISGAGRRFRFEEGFGRRLVGAAMQSVGADPPEPIDARRGAQVRKSPVGTAMAPGGFG